MDVIMGGMKVLGAYDGKLKVNNKWCRKHCKKLCFAWSWNAWRWSEAGPYGKKDATFKVPKNCSYILEIIFSKEKRSGN